MYKKTGKSEVVEKEEQVMSAAVNLERPCTISESIMQSCKEVKNMREGKTPKQSQISKYRYQGRAVQRVSHYLLCSSG